MNWKIIFIGGVVMYVAQFIVSMITGPVLHEGILDPLYKANSQFWRPELNQDPPDMAALMPRWITSGLIASFVLAGIYGAIRDGFGGPGWMRGLKYGVALTLINAVLMLGWSGVFNLPDQVWVWWSAEGILYYVVGGVALGWVAEKLAPAAT